MNYKKIVKDLKEIMEVSLDPSLFPYKKGNSIRIGHVVIRKNKNGYVLYDIREKGPALHETFSQKAAVALARHYLKHNTLDVEVLELDRQIQKNYNDSIFFKYTIENTKDDFKRETTLIRYEIAKDKTYDALDNLDRFIFY